MGSPLSKASARHSRGPTEHRPSHSGTSRSNADKQATRTASSTHDLPRSDTGHGHDDQPASVTPTPSLWDRHNPEQHGLVLQSDRYRDVLRDKLTDLVQSVDVKAMMPILRQLHVINAYTQERIEFQATRSDMVMRMVDHVQQGPLWHLHGFIRGLAVTNQEHLIGVLGLNAATYEDRPTASCTHDTHQQKQHFYKSVGSDKRLEIPMAPLPGILQHCEHSERMLGKTTLFGFDDNTPLDITPIYINQDPDCKMNQRESKSITTDELFLKLFQGHSPNTLLLEGDAGTGKSSFLRQYALTCCRDLTECHNKGPESSCEGHTWKMVIYIPAGSITGSQEAALRESLQCDEKLKDQVMAMIKENGDGVLVINDAIDELGKQADVESLRQYAISHQKDGRPKVLVSSRVGISPIEGKWFDRHLIMKGFSVEQGVLYMKRYLQVSHNLMEHPVMEHISSNTKNFEWVLMNPLRVHILTELVARGVLTLDKVKSLNTVKLLMVLEQYLLKRDEKGRRADTAETHSKQFHRACFECLLDRKRAISEAAIPANSPYMAFLSKHTVLDEYAKENITYEFSHEMFSEYMAIRGFIECLKTEPDYKRAVMLRMCSDPKMRNALHLVCGFISTYEHTLVPDMVFMIQACLIMQTERVLCDQNEVTEELLKLPALIMETLPSDLLSTSLTGEQRETIDGVYRTIQEAFNQNATSLQQSGWFINGTKKHWFYGVSALHQFITGCIRQCTSQDLQDDVYRQTVHKLLPCAGYNLVHHEADGTEVNYDRFIYPGSSRRWVDISKLTKKPAHYPDITVQAWCPSDIVQALTEFYRHQAPPTGKHCVCIDLTSPASLWGAQPGDVLTCDKWVPVLHQVLTQGVDMIIIVTDHVSLTTPVCGLLTALQQPTTPTHSLTRGVLVLDGQVSEERLEEFCVWRSTVNLTVELWNTRVLLSADQDQDYVIQLHQRVQDVMRSDHPPIYVTPSGKTFTMPMEAHKGHSRRARCVLQ